MKKVFGGVSTSTTINTCWVKSKNVKLLLINGTCVGD